MFTKNFYPTPSHLITQMLEGFTIEGKTILEPSAGKADIVNYLQEHGANTVEACENHPDLKEIVKIRCKLVEEDFFKLTKERASHYDLIVMNPPFENGDKHLLHAYSIAPAGCSIICLLNANTLQNRHTRHREELQTIIDAYGYFDVIENAFSTAERTTSVNVALVRMTKPGGDNRNEFQGFFMDGDPEQEQVNGLMSYNMIRDIVNRYTKAIEIFNEQLETAVKLREITGSFFSEEIGFQVTQEGTAVSLANFKKDLQKSAWNYIFNKMDMKKHTTQGLREKINKFVEKQVNIPFTMKNIYRMLEIVIATTAQRMDEALLEVFDKLTQHYKENRMNVEGWATNSHYLVNKRFIAPYVFSSEWGNRIGLNSYGYRDSLYDDLTKALCYITGENYDNYLSLSELIDSKYFLVNDKGYFQNSKSYDFPVKERWRASQTPTLDHDKYPGCKIVEIDKQWGQWFDFGFFRVRAYKKGTGHFEFKDENVWAMFNQRIAQIKGFPLPEKAHTTKSEEKRREQKDKAWKHKEQTETRTTESKPKTPKQPKTTAETNPIVQALIQQPINSETILNMFN
jgi:hypothetical protein